MARNTGNGGRVGAVKNRIQFKGASGHWVKQDANTGKILEVKTSDKTPFVGVAKKTDDRRS